MKVVVTGAQGFIGKAIVRAFQEAEWEVLEWVKNGPRPDPKDVVYIVHCCESFLLNAKTDTEMYEGNVEAMRIVLNFAQEADAACICNMSSMDAFGKVTVPVVDHRTPENAPNKYGIAKLVNEGLLARWSRLGKAAVSIRLPGVIGKGSHHNFLSRAMEAIKDGRPIKVRSPQALFNNVIHANDLAEFVVGLYDTMATGHKVLTVGCSAPMTMRDVIDRLIQVSGRAAQVHWSSGDDGYMIDYRRAQSLGYKAKTVSSTIGRMLI